MLKKIIPFTTVLLLFLSSLSYADQYVVTKVFDGNTIKARSIRKEILIKLAGIDAPEMSIKMNEPGQPFSRKAQSYLADLVMNKMVQIKELGSDYYRRVLGVVYLNGKNVNLRMVQVGLAEVDRGRLPKGFDPKPYRIAEYHARKANRGMWSQGDDYISPQEWLKQQHKAN
ncbi:MAG: thermonuclease family protein [Desulfobacterales bacterium]|jgi:endonuclease YncB( thermonuclease family)